MRNERACIVSEISSSERRASSLSIAKKLIRKRYLQTGTGGVDRCIVDGTNVVYRNQGMQPYVNCAFLDDGDTIIAANEQGYIDIVRLPPYEGKCNVPTRPLGRALCADLSLNLDRSNRSPRCRKIYGFHSGEAFAVGLEGGEFQIFSSERTIPWWVSKQKQLGIKQTYGNSLQDYIKYAYKVSPPRRKYRWSLDNSLAEQLRNPNIVTPELEGDFEWASGSKAHWDFREISAGSIQAVHVTAYGDYFCLRLLDSRSPQSQNDICFERHMVSSASNNAICFLNDNTVATAYSELGFCLDGRIKIWDLRMMRNDAKDHSALFVPAFPDDVAYGFDREDCVSMNIDTAYDHTLPADTTLRFSDLTLLHNGYLVASCGSRQSHFVIDPIRMKTVSVVHANGVEDVFAINRQNGNIATHNSKGSLNFFDGQRSAKDVVARKKRKMEIDTGTTTDNDKNDDGKNLDLKLEINIQDRNSLETQLSSMSFNDLGSSLIGTSPDGDIFLWRAS